MQDTLRELRIYLLGIWRRRWLGVIACWVLGVVGALYIFLMPDRYESNARIYVDTQSLLAPLLKGIAVSGDVKAEVDVVQRTLLSRPNLRQVARATDMDLQVNTAAEMDLLIEGLLANIRVNSEGAGLYRVRYGSPNPRLAKEVVQSLITIFVESNLGQNRSEMQEARSFIEAELAAYQEKLSAAERRIADFRAENAEIIGQTNYSIRLMGAKDGLADAQTRMSDAQDLRDALQTQLDATPPLLTMGTAPSVVVGGGAATTPFGRIQALRAQLDSLLLKYTESHPDVIATRRQLRRLDEQFRTADPDDPDGFANKSQTPNPVYENIQIKLLDAENEFKLAQRRVAKAEFTLKRLQEFSTIAPKLDTELAQLIRDHDIVKSNYMQMLDRRESIRMTLAVDTKTDAVQFRIVEPPEVPTKPSSPDRPLFLAAAFVFALGGGFAAAFLRSQIEETYFDPNRLEDAFGVPILGVVTQVNTHAETEKERLSKFAFMAAVASFFIFFIGLYVVLGFIQPGGASTDVAALF